MVVQTKRIYDSPAKTDGVRILVDRLWPRGISKERAAIDHWLKDVAPSPELRVWFNHDPEKFAVFSQKYRGELSRNPAVAELESLAESKPELTLLYAAKDPVANHAVVLQKFLKERA